MAKKIVYRSQDQALERALEAGAEYLVVGNRRYRLVEVESHDGDYYEPTSPEEIRVVRDALADQSPRLKGEAAREYLRARLQEHGIG